MNTTTLYYIHDPMCSWCWGFERSWSALKQQLPASIKIQYLLGGLAADTDQPMPEAMQQNIQKTWQQIQTEIPGTEFNFDFWHKTTPRRSTYPACRAVIAARQQDAEYPMIRAIQQAYYCQAKNPSNIDTLLDCATQIKLDPKRFENDLLSDKTDEIFKKERQLCQQFYIHSYPSLLLQHQHKEYPIQIYYTQAELILKQILNIIAA